jgi:RecA-family ATPase
MSPLPTVLAHQLPARPEEQRWLVTDLWAEQAVGIIGGEPKCCKSFLALDLAVSVASGTPCLRRFSVPRTGRVLLYAAEDALCIVRSRLDGICRIVGVDFDALDIHVITAPTVRLDIARDRAELEESMGALHPRLVLLDPFVRLHRIDENASAEVAPLLAYLRGLQRHHGAAVVVVHHAKKGAGRARAGQALRGSSEFHAWGDSNLYLRRQDDESLTLAVEHRAAAPIPAISLALQGPDDDTLALTVTERAKPVEPPVRSLNERITGALIQAGRPLSATELRSVCRVRNSTLRGHLADLINLGVLAKSNAGYELASQ